MPAGDLLDAAAIRHLRPPKPTVDPWSPQGVIDETERLQGGTRQHTRTVFLTGAECPFTCVFCDLWRFTTDEATPRHALPRQLESALEDGAPAIECLKLYNASNFFDPRAVPPEDLDALAQLAGGRSRVVVECHPRLVDQRCLDFAGKLDGTLELALGLETAHPDALARLNKDMSLDDFDRACEFARRHALGLRCFVLIGAPFIPGGEAAYWIEESVRHAIAQGVGHIALVPVRSGNGALEALAQAGHWTRPTAGEIELALSSALGLAGTEAVVTLDLWDIELHVADSPCCAADRIARLRQMTASGKSLPAPQCPHCDGVR